MAYLSIRLSISVKDQIDRSPRPHDAIEIYNWPFDGLSVSIHVSSDCDCSPPIPRSRNPNRKKSRLAIRQFIVSLSIIRNVLLATFKETNLQTGILELLNRNA